jgi:hypothetical protein
MSVDDLPAVPDTEDSVIDAVEELVIQGTKNQLICMWHVGRIISIAKAREGSTYGKQFMDKVATRMGKDSPRVLTDAVNFYDLNNSLDAIKDLNISWTSARVLNRVKDIETRKELLEQCKGEDPVPLVDVEEMVKSAFKQNPESRSRKPAAINPKTYFKRVHASMDGAHKKLQDLMGQRFDMYPVLADEDRVTDADFEVTEEIISKITDLSATLISFIETNVAVIQGELAEHLPDDPAEKTPAKKAK